MAVEFLCESPLATVQDTGRTGRARYGYRRCGACDAWSARIAGLLCGNEAQRGQDAVIEFTLRGGTLRFTEDTLFAVTGAECDLLLEDTAVPMYQSRRARAGQRLTIGTAKTGLRIYLAVGGGIALAPVLGSRSTDTVCGLGGYGGRKLRKGDLLPVGSPSSGRERELPRAFPLCPPGRVRWAGSESIRVLRVVPGPQDELFSEAAGQIFRRSIYEIGSDSNRMGCRLSGPPVPVPPGNMISDPIVEGSVQISSGGQPIVMMADHQTTGGYPKIGTVIHSDLSALAQMRPGERAAFSFVTVEEAQAVRRRDEGMLRELARRLAEP